MEKEVYRSDKLKCLDIGTCLIKIISGIQTKIVWDTQIHRNQGEFIGPISYLKIKKIGQKYFKILILQANKDTRIKTISRITISLITKYLSSAVQQKHKDRSSKQ